MGETNTGPPPPCHGTAQKEEDAARMDPSREVNSGDRLKTGFVFFVATPNTCRSCIQTVGQFDGHTLGGLL